MRIVNLSADAEDFTGNVWLIDGREKVLVDAGTGDVVNSINQLEAVDKVVVTHSHYDHVDNLQQIVERYDPEIYAFEPGNLDVDAERLDDGDNIELDGQNYAVIHTPGHRDDSVCLYNLEARVLFTGDLLFPEGGFGRTDLEQGDRDQLIQSIRKLIDLDVNMFYPGHGEQVVQKAEESIKQSLEQAEKHEAKYE
jgi:glyoxylase-like metal-dependent hydrolase (beta-lactamase superfamily II)